MNEKGERDKITKEWCKENLGLDNVNCCGVDALCIKWLPQGIRFSIAEYDGAEVIYREDELDNKSKR
jgi:hypothetical protein